MSWLSHGSIIPQAFWCDKGQKKASYCCTITLMFMEIYKCTKATPNPKWSGTGLMHVTTAANSKHTVIPVVKYVLKKTSESLLCLMPTRCPKTL